MVSKIVAPGVNLNAFSCPHCGALTHQYWYLMFGQPLGDEHVPDLWSQERIEREVKDIPASSRDGFRRYWGQFVSGLPIQQESSDGTYLRHPFYNLHASECFTCKKLSIWLYDKLLYPSDQYGPQPNEDLPDEIQADYLEASTILDLSPRGSAALLRLCIQKLCVHLGESGRDLNTDIGSLVKKGLDKRVQKALDVVRVLGNEAVHPGQIDLKDDRETAAKLFVAVNLIAEIMITQLKQLDALYDEKIPEGKRAAIEKRDSTGK